HPAPSPLPYTTLFRSAPGHAPEELEDAAVVDGRDADAVVAHREADAAVLDPTRHRDLAVLGGDVLDRVAEQVADDVPELARLSPHARQRADRHPDPLGRDLGTERLERLVDQRAQLDPGRGFGLRGDAEQLEQVADHVLGASRQSHDALEVLAAVGA